MRKVARWLLMGCFLSIWVHLPAHAEDITERFQLIYQAEGELAYEVVGRSLVDRLGKESVRLFDEGMSEYGVVKKAFLIWAGAVGTKDQGGVKEIVLKDPKGMRNSVRADSIQSEAIGGQEAFTAVSDVTSLVKYEGEYEVLGLRINKRYFGGFGIMIVYEKNSLPMRQISLHAGMTRLKPGEIYEAKILGSGVSGILSKVSVVGGGGKAGNGSSNSINGVTVSGRDDWDGSSGSKWDVDNYEVRKYALSLNNGNKGDKGITWSIDPLLQWLFPVAIMTQIDLKGVRKGGEK